MFDFLKPRFGRYLKSRGSEIKKSLLFLPRPSQLLKGSQDALRQNLEDEEKLAKAGFDKILREWGIESDQDLKMAIRERRASRRLGIFLFCLGLVLEIQQFFWAKQSLYWASLQGFFYLSLILLGSLMIASCTWRLKVFEARKFVSFLTWLRKGGRM